MVRGGVVVAGGGVVLAGGFVVPVVPPDVFESPLELELLLFESPLLLESPLLFELLEEVSVLGGATVAVVLEVKVTVAAASATCWACAVTAA